ncbi:MAG: bifunctional pyr operon transcriptional regulator/uracil phosphoribosyltransferase [Burkholderiales bacterium 12-64-5]|nr:MAG: bifunctional pyr operon transcriptional regulator/uracil phosphoribosyltransferase [Burkholderiales bacterium 12-64-5]
MRGEIDVHTALIGIHSGGVWIAERLHAMLGLDLPLGTLDVSFYRDDFERRGLKSGVKPSAMPFDVQGRDIVLVDDVLYTGRTIRAALNVLFDYGRPARVRLAALVDRGGRELPIDAAFVGGVMQVAGADVVVLDRDAAGRLSLSITGGDR